MPGPGYAGGRWDYTPTKEEIEIIENIFNSEFEIPENFKTTAKVFEPPFNVRDLSKIPMPVSQVNPQTEQFCEKLGIDDPISLIEQTSEESLKLSDFKDYNNDSDLTFQVTRNEDEIQLDDSDDDDEGDNKGKHALIRICFGFTTASYLQYVI